MTEDMGNTWTTISSNLPNRGSVYAIEEDHEDPGLIFVEQSLEYFFHLIMVRIGKSYQWVFLQLLQEILLYRER